MDLNGFFQVEETKTQTKPSRYRIPPLFSRLRAVLLLFAVCFTCYIIVKGPNIGSGPLRGNWMGLVAWGFSVWLLLDTSTKVLFTLYDEPGGRGKGLWYWIATMFLGQKVVLLVSPGEEKPKAVRPAGPLASFFARLGAPGIVIIDNGAAVVFERSGRFTRVHGPGIAFTQRFEKIYRIVDLRPRICQGEIKNIQTRDGWTFDVQLYVSLQVATGFDRNTGKYIYNEGDILNLVYGGGYIYIDSEEIDSDGQILGLVDYHLRKIATEWTIEDIIPLKHELFTRVQDRAADAAQAIGIRLAAINVVDVALPPAAQQVQQAVTERETIVAIAQGLQEALSAVRGLQAELTSPAPHLVVNLSSTLERIARDFQVFAGPSPEVEIEGHLSPEMGRDAPEVGA